MSSATEQQSIAIRDIELISERREVEALQKEVWGCDDRDVVPLTLFSATREVGAILIGAFDGSSLVGFAYGFVGCESGQVVHHLHILAVSRSYRNFNLGYKLRLAQRERALAQGITRMTWTFDPLQSLNAHFNFNKLGVLADRYKIDSYGERKMNHESKCVAASLSNIPTHLRRHSDTGLSFIPKRNHWINPNCSPGGHSAGCQRYSHQQ